MLTLLLLLWAFRAVASFGGGGGDSSGLLASGVLPREDQDVHVGASFFLTLGFTWGLFCMFANMFSHLSFPPLVCSSTLHPNLLQLVTFICVRCYFFVLFATRKTSFVQLRSFFSRSRVSCLQQCQPAPCPFSSHTCSPPHRIPSLCCFRPLLQYEAKSSSLHCIIALES